MKIDKTSTPLPSTPVGEGRTNAAQKNSANPAPLQTASTSVSLGSAATHLRNMEETMSGSSPVNAAKVAEIKQAISEGRFRINSDVVADRLISSVRELIGNKA
ncbi:MAG TPA: flagellar biosynthesis anti-sigma factor FlgM [Gallionella sp.]|nr:flagellar biosynthesis anti-sigma factor FlgM [Gallionella sp.]